MTTRVDLDFARLRRVINQAPTPLDLVRQWIRAELIADGWRLAPWARISNVNVIWPGGRATVQVDHDRLVRALEHAVDDSPRTYLEFDIAGVGRAPIARTMFSSNALQHEDPGAGATGGRTIGDGNPQGQIGVDEEGPGAEDENESTDAEEVDPGNVTLQEATEGSGDSRGDRTDPSNDDAAADASESWNGFSDGEDAELAEHESTVGGAEEDHDTESDAGAETNEGQESDRGHRIFKGNELNEEAEGDQATKIDEGAESSEDDGRSETPEPDNFVDAPQEQRASPSRDSETAVDSAATADVGSGTPQQRQVEPAYRYTFRHIHAGGSKSYKKPDKRRRQG